MPSSARRLDRGFYDRPTLEVARDLLGAVLVHASLDGIAAGMIVETEAYIGESDPACHAAPGPTVRNAPLYGRPGMAYVYLNYGLHHLVNAVTEQEGRPAAVLIRALEPIDGLALMARRRARPPGVALPAAALCRGPGNLARALGITLDQNRADLTGRLLWIEDRAFPRGRVARGPRVGIRVGTERPWRFWLAGHPCVSGSRAVNKL